MIRIKEKRTRTKEFQRKAWCKVPAVNIRNILRGTGGECVKDGNPKWKIDITPRTEERTKYRYKIAERRERIKYNTT